MLLAAVVVFAALTMFGLARLGGAVVDRAQARTAADAAALAAVIDEPDGAGAGRRTAAEIAERNGAELIDYDVDGSAVEVSVRVGGSHATSRADRYEADPRPPR